MTKPLPVVLYDSKFWKTAINFEHFAKSGLVSSKDLELFSFADTPQGVWDELIKLGLPIPA